jgi:hypothetical protein
MPAIYTSGAHQQVVLGNFLVFLIIYILAPSILSMYAKLGGGISDHHKIEKFAGMLGEIYGGGEYAVSELELLSVAPDVSNQVLVIGGAAKIRPTEESHSASTVEIELRNLFRFPQRARRQLVAKKVRKPRKGRFRGGDDVVRLSDVDIYASGGESHPLPSQTSPEDDYAIAREIDAHIGGSDDSSEGSGSEGSGSEGSGSEDLPADELEREGLSENADSETGPDSSADMVTIGSAIISISTENDAREDTPIDGAVIDAQCEYVSVFDAIVN